MTERDDEPTGVHRMELRQSMERFHEVKAALREKIARLLERSPRDRPLVLVVDDEPVVADTFGRLLRDGCEIMVAATVAEALRSLDICNPDLVILDLALPDGNGYEVAAVGRARGIRCPILVVSGYIDDEVQRSFARLPGPIELASKNELREVCEKVRQTLRTPRGTPKV